ncbi:M50 family metallopeptidase [Candidatus Woesearchaeota archaeon]|nr:M50 family metallopeptidase [Candidatus Woesearchaeota archaeon]
MAFVTFGEIIDLVIMIAAVGFIFKDRVQIRPTGDYDPLTDFRKQRFFSEGFKNAVIVTAPAIALHELGHKAAAMAYGFDATFHAAYTWLGIGVVLKLLNFPFLFFVPGYVTYSAANIEPLVRALIAFAGPLVNLLLFLFATAALKQGWLKKYAQHLVLTKQINMFLFIFNMLPFGFFDGAQVFSSLMQAFGG